jgi:hypothetical protein
MTLRRFTAADDLLHDIAGRQNGRESLFYVLPVPHERLLALAYVFKDESTGRFGRIVALADGVSPEPLFLDMAGDLELEGDDLDDFVVGGLHVRQPEPLQVAELSFLSADGFGLECRLEGTHAPFSWHDGPEGCPPWAADDRYEQSVRTRGTLTLPGRTVDCDSAGHRDHSWGTRDWRPLQHWKWINATAIDEDISLHGWISYALGDRQINGYVSRGGVVSPIVAAEARAQLDDTFMHTSVSGTFTTADGRRLPLEATSVAGLPIPARHMQMNEIACSATLDGHAAIAHIELGWPQSYIAEYTAPGAEPRVENAVTTPTNDRSIA